MKKLALATLLGATLVMTGCASSLGGDSYSRGEARGEMSVRFGTLLAVRDVQIEGQGGSGSLVGALVGGLAGAGLDDGKTGIALGVLGAAGGAVLGDKLGKAATAAQGVEYTVRLDNGQILAIVQEKSPAFIAQLGQRIRIVGGGRTSRVGPA